MDQKKYNTWDEQKKYLVKLVKEVSAQNGGDDLEFLQKYIDQLKNKYRTNLGVAIACMESAHDECRRIRFLAALEARSGV